MFYKQSFQNSAPKYVVQDNVPKGSINKIREHLRKRRNIECFPVINRGKLWYDLLSTDKYIELKNWYQAWLDVTDTLIVPDTPTWLNDKLESEELY